MIVIRAVADTGKEGRYPIFGSVVVRQLDECKGARRCVSEHERQ